MMVPSFVRCMSARRRMLATTAKSMAAPYLIMLPLAVRKVHDAVVDCVEAPPMKTIVVFAPAFAGASSPAAALRRPVSRALRGCGERGEATSVGERRPGLAPMPAPDPSGREAGRGEAGACGEAVGGRSDTARGAASSVTASMGRGGARASHVASCARHAGIMKSVIPAAMMAVVSTQKPAAAEMMMVA